MTQLLSTDDHLRNHAMHLRNIINSDGSILFYPYNGAVAKPESEMFDPPLFISLGNE